MDKESYKKLVKSKNPKESRCFNAVIAFLVGGFLGLLGEVISKFIVIFTDISVDTSYAIVCLIYIFIASIFTAFGFFDEWVKKCKCGIIIPTTGFAHSVSSSALEFKKDGMITGLGANFFKLAGSVILYGITSAFFLCFLKVIIYG